MLFTDGTVIAFGDPAKGGVMPQGVLVSIHRLSCGEGQVQPADDEALFCLGRANLGIGRLLLQEARGVLELSVFSVWLCVRPERPF